MIYDGKCHKLFNLLSPDHQHSPSLCGQQRRTTSAMWIYANRDAYLSLLFIFIVYLNTFPSASNCNWQNTIFIHLWIIKVPSGENIHISKPLITWLLWSIARSSFSSPAEDSLLDCIISAPWPHIGRPKSKLNSYSQTAFGHEMHLMYLCQIPSLVFSRTDELFIAMMPF